MSDNATKDYPIPVLEAPHVKKWWDQDVTYTFDLVREKYSSYIKGYKPINGIQKPILRFILTSTLTVGLTAGHTDVSLWYVLKGDSNKAYEFDKEEFNDIGWFHINIVIENSDEIIGTCHLTLMPSFTFIGSTRMQIEAVRGAGKYRGQKIASLMFDQAISYAKEHDVSIIQITTNKKRSQAKHFFEKLGFEASDQGVKIYLEQVV